MADNRRRRLELELELAKAHEAQSSGSYREKATAKEAAPEEDEGTDWIGGINQFGQGLSMGMADEIGTGIAATAVKAMGGEEDWTDIYDSMMESEARKRSAFQKKNPKTSLALNLAGGLATGGAGAAKLIPQGLTKAKALAAGLGVASAEGAVTGFASANPGSRLKGAGMGAALGPLAKAGLDTVGKGVGMVAKPILNQIGKRRIAQDVTPGDKFMPINMTEDRGALQNFYRNTVAPAIGGGNIAKQSQAVIDRAAEKSQKTGRALGKTTAQLEGKRAAESARHGIESQQGIDAIARRGDDLIDSATSRSAGSQMAKDSSFRNRAAQESLPGSAPSGAADDLASMTPTQANKYMDEIWAKHGFSGVRGRDFNINTKDVVDKTLEKMDGAAMAEFAPAIRSRLTNAFNSKMDLRGKPEGFSTTTGLRSAKPDRTKGSIKGDDLMSIRNSLRMEASALQESGESALKGAALRKAAHAIDEQIKLQLGSKSKDFVKELSAWGTRRTYDGAVTKGLDKFSPKDWMAASKAYSNKRYARGDAPLQSPAQSNIADQEWAGSSLKKTLSDIKSGTSKATGLAKSRAKRDAQNIKDAAQPDSLSGLKRSAEAAKKAESTLKARAPAKNVNPATKFIATAALSAPGIAAAGLPGIASGAGVAKLLTIQKVQQFIAGQTDKQKALAQWLITREGVAPKLARELAKNAAVRGFVASQDEE
tara:strand:+ start:13931 stop:16057 length:2127 start_codon:yes stop_codon:yes gene_type:complete